MQSCEYLCLDQLGEVVGWGTYFGTICTPDDPRKAIVNELVKFLLEKSSTYLRGLDAIATTGSIRLDFEQMNVSAHERFVWCVVAATGA